MNIVKSILTIGIAAGVGIATGMLIAPRKGKQTRAKLLKDFDRQKDSLELAANRKLEEAKSILAKTIEVQKKNGVSATKKVKTAVSS